MKEAKILVQIFSESNIFTNYVSLTSEVIFKEKCVFSRIHNFTFNLMSPFTSMKPFEYINPPCLIQSA